MSTEKVFHYFPETFSEVKTHDGHVKSIVDSSQEAALARALSLARVESVVSNIIENKYSHIQSDAFLEKLANLKRVATDALADVNEDYISLMEAEESAHFTKRAAEKARLYARDNVRTDIGIEGLEDVNAQGASPLEAVFDATFSELQEAASEQVLNDERFKTQIPKYVKFRQEIHSKAKPNDLQLSREAALKFLDGNTVQFIGSTICPLTRADFIEPVRALCGHHFSRDAILQWLPDGVNRCPVVGCSHKIRRDELKDDPEFIEQVLAWKEMQERGREAHTMRVQAI